MCRPAFVFLFSFLAVQAELDLNGIKGFKTTTKFNILNFKGFKTSYSIPTTAPLTCTSGCWQDWIPYKGACYKRFDQTTNMATAERLCTVHNGHLVSFASAADVQTVTELTVNAYRDGAFGIPTQSTIWIGVKGSKWTDGSPLSYTNFATAPEANKCAQIVQNITSMGWISVDCNSIASSYICRSLATS